MRNFFYWLSALLLSISGLLIFHSYQVGIEKNIYEISLIFLGVTISIASQTFIINGDHLMLFANTFFSFNRNKKLRVAFSYLYRISIKDENKKTKYLLVRNSNMENQMAFQPVGGVYKYFDRSFLNSIEALDAENFHELKDLRVKIPKKNLSKILSWFNKNKDREIDHFREFHEELIHTKILPEQYFPWINSKFLSQKNSGLRYSEFFQCEEIVFYDVLEFIPNEKQNLSLYNILNIKSDEFIWVDEDFIKRKGFDYSKNKDTCKICEHTEHILFGN